MQAELGAGVEPRSLVQRRTPPEASKGQKNLREVIAGARRTDGGTTGSVEGGTEVQERMCAADLTPRRAASGNTPKAGPGPKPWVEQSNQ